MKTVKHSSLPVRMGVANPRRGRGYREYAFRLFDAFPPPATIRSAELDAFLAEIDAQYLGSGITTHCRANWMSNMRKASEHSDMNTGHYFAFTTRCIGRELWRSESVEKAISLGFAVEQLAQAAEAAKLYHKYLMEGLPVERLSETELLQLFQYAQYTEHTLANCILIAKTGLDAHQGFTAALTSKGRLRALPDPGQ